MTFQCFHHSVDRLGLGRRQREPGGTDGKTLSHNELAYLHGASGALGGVSRWGAVGRGAKLTVPNPGKPLKGRLDAPGAKVHKSRKRYRRRAKHPSRHAD